MIDNRAHRLNNVLVTGGAGFIGSNFIHHLLSINSSVKIINLDLLTYAGNLGNLDKLPNSANYKFIHGDICDHSLVEKLIIDYHIDTIVNFAAETHVDRSIMRPEPFVRANIYGTFSLLEAARKIWLDETSKSNRTVRFHHVSTDEVFGSLDVESSAFSEATPYAPNSPYAASKASSDHMVRAYSNTYGLPVTISNCSNNYGPYQFPEKLIPLMILAALKGENLPVYGDGNQIRDWLFVKDHCEAICLILETGDVGETYNVGGDNQPTNLSIVEKICDLLDEFQPLASGKSYRRLISFVSDRPGHDRRYAMDITKIQNTLGWKPRHSLTAGLRSTVRWYLSNIEWVANISSQAGYQMWIKDNYHAREEKK